MNESAIHASGIVVCHNEFGGHAQTVRVLLFSDPNGTYYNCMHYAAKGNGWYIM